MGVHIFFAALQKYTHYKPGHQGQYRPANPCQFFDTVKQAGCRERSIGRLDDSSTGDIAPILVRPGTLASHRFSPDAIGGDFIYIQCAKRPNDTEAK
jgi:hypothetical protein